MPRLENRALHWRVIREAQQRFAPGSNRRLELIHRALQGIRETYRPDFNPFHAQQTQAN